MKFIIKDWAGNVLGHKGYFAPSYLAVPMKFESFDDGWDWILENVLDENSHENLYVEEL